MTIAFEAAETIRRSPDEVWARLTDWRNAPDWMNGIDSMSAGGPTAVGTTLVFRARGKDRSSEITHLVPGEEVTLTSRQGPVSASYTYRCAPQGDATAVGLVADCEIRGPLRLLGPLLRIAVARTDGSQLQALKSVLEAS